MKELIVIRHAKSSWANALQSDFDRPLNERGNKDAPFMANQILKNSVDLDLILSSNAKRAVATTQYFSEVFNKATIQLEPKLYQAPSRIFYDVIQQISNQYNKVAIVAHNTGLTDFVNSLSNVHVDIVPTCGIYATKIDIEDWAEFKKTKKAFWFFDFPKNNLVR